VSRARPCGDPSLMFESLVHIAVVEGEAAEDMWYAPVRWWSAGARRLWGLFGPHSNRSTG